MDIHRQQQFNGDAIRHELLKQYNRATTTSTEDVDLLAIDLFATMVQQYEAFITLDATKIIAEKFKSPSADEVLLALNVLEECMSKCGPKFHSEVGKFRFLNELIRLVSPQYDGDKTPKKIRDKILDLMLLWTINYPHEKKIKEAYDMLLKRGVKHETAKPVVMQNSNKPDVEMKNAREKAEPDLAAKLQRLLRSTNAADHKAANLLIQNMVKEKERRHEVKMRRKLEVKELTENATLLMDMLEQIEIDQRNGVSEAVSEDTLATLKCLNDSCQKLQPTINILLNDTDDNDCFDDALEANDLVTSVSQKYIQILSRNKSKNSNPCLISTSEASSLANNQNGTARNTMDELNEIFASSGSGSGSSGSNSINSHSNIRATLNAKLLEPTMASAPVNNSENASTIQAIKNLNSLLSPTSPSKSAPKPVDSFSHLLSNDSLPAVTIPLSKAPTAPTSATAAISEEKLNATQKKFQNFDSELTQLISGLKSNLSKEADESPQQDDDKLLLDDIEPVEQSPIKVEPIVDPIVDKPNKSIASPVVECSSQITVNKPLAEIVIDLNDIRPHDDYAPRCIMDEKGGVKITLNFTKDKPRTDIAVLVITTTNHSKLPIRNFQFEASVQKPCKLHLQKPSGHELPGIKPFRPPTEDITQILLISNAEKKMPLKLVCIISYNVGDDPDMAKEFLSEELPDLFN